MPNFNAKTKDDLNRHWPAIKSQIERYDDGKGICLSVMRPSKTRQQEEMYHAIIGDIARHGHAEYKGHRMEFNGLQFPAATVAKVTMLSWFEDELKTMGLTLKNPSGWIMVTGISMPVLVRAESSKFSVEEGGWFINFLTSLCAENQIHLSDPGSRTDEQWAREG